MRGPRLGSEIKEEDAWKLEESQRNLINFPSTF
jgi:hypothetical protein